ncbi:MAG: Stp1/IreP family PP2C-type Ser/Thr phosphatase [Proteobacteria bacterium]|nr:Stp1/IreP family PP2C-type Ser/Thr phosphatase [Pseudomonadota bacterium]
MDFTAKFDFFGKSDVGLKRECNEDAFAVRPDLNLCLAADGMGGAAAGEVASHIFVGSVLRAFETMAGYSENDITHIIKKAFFLANRDILNHARENPQHKGMGCTAELLAFTDSGFIVGHVGDSRTYRLRDGKLTQLTHDHSLVQEQVDKGLISEAEAKQHAMRNIVLRAIGVDQEISIDLLKGKILSGDQFLLCSDGLTDMISAYDIEKTLITDNDLSTKADTLIELAKSRGGLDNITVVMAAVS